MQFEKNIVLETDKRPNGQKWWVYQVDGTEYVFKLILQSGKWGTLAFVITTILFWGVVAGFLHMKGIFVKL